MNEIISLSCMLVALIVWSIVLVLIIPAAKIEFWKNLVTAQRAPLCFLNPVAAHLTADQEQAD